MVGFSRPAQPPVQIAEPGIGRPDPVLLPQQRQGYIGTAQVAMHPGPVGHRPLIREQQRFQFQLLVIEIYGQGFGKGLSHSGKPELGQLVECRMGQQDVISSVVVARSADIGVEQRRVGGRWRLRSLAIELVVEDRAHRAVGQGADLDRPYSGFEAIGTEGTRQSDNAETSAETLLRVGPTLQDELVQCGRGRTDRSGLAANALDGPIGVAPMA
jgi:hypothetical protein